MEIIKLETLCQNVVNANVNFQNETLLRAKK